MPSRGWPGKPFRRATASACCERAGGKLDRIDAKIVFEAAREGDAAAQTIVDTIVERLAIGVANICCILNPAVVILGAGLSQAGADLLEPLAGARRGADPDAAAALHRFRARARAVILGAVEHALRAIEAARFNLFADAPGPAPHREVALA